MDINCKLFSALFRSIKLQFFVTYLVVQLFEGSFIQRYLTLTPLKLRTTERIPQIKTLDCTRRKPSLASRVSNIQILKWLTGLIYLLRCRKAESYWWWLNAWIIVMSLQKVRRNASPLNGRQNGPVKATVPFTYNDSPHSLGSSKSVKKASPDRQYANSPASRGNCRQLMLKACIYNLVFCVILQYL